MIALETILAKDVHEIIASRELSGAVLTHYRHLYTGGMPVRSCESSIKGYFRRLQIDGLETKKRLDMSKYQLKKEIGCIRFNNQMYNSSTITDEIAEQIVKEYPKLASSFVIKAEERQPSEKDRLLIKAIELGVEGADKLSTKKLKEAIAEKEIAEQEKHDALVLQAIELGIEGADEKSVEELEKLIQ